MAINLLAGLEKFGIGGKEAFDITGDDGGRGEGLLAGEEDHMRDM